MPPAGVPGWLARVMARADNLFWRINWMLWYRVFLGVPWWTCVWFWRATLSVRLATNQIPVLMIRLARARPFTGWARFVLLLSRGGLLLTVGAERLEGWAWRRVES
jgi:hypothetical protein